MKRISRASSAVVLAMALGACSDVTFEGSRLVDIALTADRTTAARGQDVTFDFDVTGTVLDGVIIRFGDDVADTMMTSGAQSAHGKFVHAYSAAGTFTAVATVYDAVQGQDSAKVVIQVTGG